VAFQWICVGASSINIGRKSLVRMDGFKLEGEGGELFKEDFRKLLKQE